MASIWDNLGEDSEKKEETKADNQHETAQNDDSQETKSGETADNGDDADMKEKNSEQEKETEEKPKVTLREMVIERGRSQYPDDYGEGDFDDERYEMMVGRMLEDGDKRNGELGKLKESSSKLFAIFSEHPDTMQVFENLKNGMSLKKALTEVYGSKYLDLEPDSEEEKAYVRQREDEDKRNKEIADNLKASEGERKKFYEESGMTDEEIKAFENAEDEFWNSYGNGKFDSNYYNMIRNHINHDSDVKNAEEQGRISGRNEKIVEEKFREKGDGIPTNEGGSGKTGGKNKKDEEEVYENDLARQLSEMNKNKRSVYDL